MPEKPLAQAPSAPGLRSETALDAARSLATAQLQDLSPDLARTTAERSLALAEILGALGADEEIVVSAILFPLVSRGLLSRRKVQKQFGDEIARLVRELTRLGAFELPARWDSASRLDTQQAEGLRKMLFAIVEDVRLVLVRLADHLHLMRVLKVAPEAERRRAALETREIFAPLANRLGIWQIKWELEDLAFRYLEPDIYMDIARQLNERRADREAYIENVLRVLHDEVSAAGIKGDIQGRPKHIYSIWRKMQRKETDIEHIFDMRAVRVLVDTTADCYTVLGIVHGRWQYIRGEFDDYIATPKENNYQSLHTAVIGPGGKTLEIQIRTYEMHSHSELGVAAHWRYKEGGRDDKVFRRKLNWLRQLLEPGEDPESERDFIDRIKSDLFEDRVYVLTPEGDVVDLPAGATPLDFAYHVHTELGHLCRGARVNGRLVQLTYKLRNGEKIEVITARNASPSRDWLIPQLGYLASSRARAKVRQWFRRHEQERNVEHGQTLLERELHRLSAKPPHINLLARELNAPSATDLYAGLGSGDISLQDLAAAVQRLLAPPKPATEDRLKPRRKHSARSGSQPIDIEGVGDLLTNLASCCKPVPPDPIAGYITQGRGVSIHRDDCANMLRLTEKNRERVLDVSWRQDQPDLFPVDIRVEAYDRKGLIKDVSTVLATDKVNITAMEIRTDKASLSAQMDLTIEISDLSQLSAVLLRLGGLSNIISVHRKR